MKPNPKQNKTSAKKKPGKTKDIPLNDTTFYNIFKHGFHGSELIDKFWFSLMEKQQIINGQIEENDKKNFIKAEEKKRLLEESERKFFQQIKENNRQTEEIFQKIYGLQFNNTPKYEDSTEEYQKVHKKTNQIKIKTEHLVCPAIIKWFCDHGYYFNDMSIGRKILDDNGNIKAEFDIILENSNCITAVEVLKKPKKTDIEFFIDKIKILKDHRYNYNDYRKIHGAITGFQFGKSEKQLGVETGFFIFEQSGKTIKFDIPDGFLPQEW